MTRRPLGLRPGAVTTAAVARGRVRLPGAGPRAGFTLVELLVAVSISVVVAGAAYAALTGGLSVYERTGEAALRTQVARTLADRLREELQAVYFNPEATDAVFTGEEADGTAGWTGAQLTFVTTAAGAPLAEVTYSLREPDEEGEQPGGLYRATRPLLDRQVTEAGSEVESSEEVEAVALAPEVVGFEVAYYDPLAVGSSGGLGLRGSLTSEDEWQSSWDGEAKGYLPRAVKLTFRLGSWEDEEGSDGSSGATAVPSPGPSFALVVLLPVADATIERVLASAQQDMGEE